MAIDQELQLAISGGGSQVVILGAGLDGRAHRMHELSTTAVFEVDHPATQGYKRAKAASLPSVARELKYVAVNFEMETLGQILVQSGHRSDAPTAWVWEGVVMYLSDPALRQTLSSIVERSAPGSVLLVQYNEPNSTSEEARRWGRLVSLLGEPQIGLRSQATMAAELSRVGLSVLRDTSALDWASQYARGAAPLRGAPHATRLAVAVLK